MASISRIRLLWAVEILSRTGETFFQITLLWFVLKETGSNLTTGAVTMVSFLPALVVGLWSGVVVDRINVRWVMLTATAVRAMLAGLIPLLYWNDSLSIGLLALVAFLLSSASAFFNPARDASVPRLVPYQQLLSANSLIQSAWPFALLIGPFVLGLLMDYVPVHELFFMASGAFILTGLLLLVLRLPANSTSDASPPSTSVWSFGASWREGWNFLKTHPAVRWVLVLTATNNLFLMGAAMVGIPVYVQQYLGGDGQDYAFVEGTYALGMVLTTVVLSKVGQRFSPVRMLMWGIIYDGLTYMPLFWLNSVYALLLAIFIHSLGIPTIVVSRTTAMHQLVPSALHGRVFAFVNLAVAGMTAISVGGVGIVLEWMAPNELFLWIGVLAAMSGMIGLLLPSLKTSAVQAAKTQVELASAQTAPSSMP